MRRDSHQQQEEKTNLWYLWTTLMNMLPVDDGAELQRHIDAFVPLVVWVTVSSVYTRLGRLQSFKSLSSAARIVFYHLTTNKQLVVVVNISHVKCYVSRVTCHMSRVTCHMSHVTCHMSQFYFIFIYIYVYIFFFFFSDKMVKLIGGGSVINGAYPV